MNNTENKSQILKKQASNIDEKGNVLYLDQERLDRKVVGFPPYKNRPNGLGIFNWILEHILYMSDKRWPLALKLYKIFVRFSVWMKKGGWRARLYKRGIMLYPDMERPTSTVVLPLNVDVESKEQGEVLSVDRNLTDSSEEVISVDMDIAEENQKVVVPLELIKESLKKVDYIAGMNECLCREANDCKDYPHKLGCLFLGEAAKVVVKHNLGRRFTYEEACARVDEAARVGLMGQAVWIEVEQMLWGVRNDMMDHFLEICFCCPCCCIAMRLARNATAQERHRFHPSGWTAVPDRTKCIGCKKCANTTNGCPVEAISFGKDGKVQINQEICVGCGICRSRCPVDAIKIKQTMPMRQDLQEYFLKDYSLDLKLGKDERR